MADDEHMIEAVWSGGAHPPVLATNQLLVQVAGVDEIVVSLGHVLPPMFHGTPAEREAQVLETSTVPINVLGRFGITRARLEELRDLLDEYLAGPAA